MNRISLRTFLRIAHIIAIYDKWLVAAAVDNNDQLKQQH